jgi:hypothetical protein
MREAARKRVRRETVERKESARTRTHARTHTDMTSKVGDVFAARSSWSVNISSVRARTVVRVRVRACKYRPSRARPATGSLSVHTHAHTPTYRPSRARPATGSLSVHTHSLCTMCVYRVYTATGSLSVYTHSLCSFFLCIYFLCIFSVYTHIHTFTLYTHMHIHPPIGHLAPGQRQVVLERLSGPGWALYHSRNKPR